VHLLPKWHQDLESRKALNPRVTHHRYQERRRVRRPRLAQLQIRGWRRLLDKGPVDQQEDHSTAVGQWNGHDTAGVNEENRNARESMGVSCKWVDEWQASFRREFGEMFGEFAIIIDFPAP
jgi:hypothetical protein